MARLEVWQPRSRKTRGNLLPNLLTGYAGGAAALAVGGALSGAFSLLRKPVGSGQFADPTAVHLGTKGRPPRDEGWAGEPGNAKPSSSG